MVMADITKRTNKRAAKHLDGEVLDVVLLCEMKGALGLGAVGSVLATRTANRVMEQRSGERLEAEGGIASSFPAKTCAVGITATRVVAIPSNGIKFEAPELAVERGHVRAEVTGRKGLGKRMELIFSDGSVAQVDVGGMQPLDRFLELINA